MVWPQAHGFYVREKVTGSSPGKASDPGSGDICHCAGLQAGRAEQER